MKKTSSKKARRMVSDWTKAIYASKSTTNGLPDDIMLRALEGYGSRDVSRAAVRDKGRDFREYVLRDIVDCTVRYVFRSPIGNRAPAASVNIFRLAPGRLRSSETLFGAFSYTFTFWASGVWFLSANDPLCTTDHLHQRLIERSLKEPRRIVQTQDDLSVLWPALLQMGQRRRLRGLAAGVSHFVTPIHDGLVFGEMQKNDFNGMEDVAAAAPVLIDFHNGGAFEHNLFDFHSNGRELLLVVLRTFIGPGQLREPQLRLKQDLDKFIQRHRQLLEVFRLRARLAFDSDPPYGRAHYKLYANPPTKLSQLEVAMSDLEQITSSKLWSEVIMQSIASTAKRSVLSPPNS